ncbi:uncharacterized protein L199_003140 [Kwoniella botswanensis]|uniref:uncharacterized protein n=1 Tax=Kwoniella botswanensis TaxID=1268659 RepID=UPI00315C56DC
MMYRTVLAGRRAPVSLKPIVSARLYATDPHPTSPPPTPRPKPDPTSPPSSGPGGPSGSGGMDTPSGNGLLYVGAGVTLIGAVYFLFGGSSTEAVASRQVRSHDAPLKQAELYTKGTVDRVEGKAAELTGKAKGQYEEAKGEVKKVFK